MRRRATQWRNTALEQRSGRCNHCETVFSAGNRCVRCAASLAERSFRCATGPSSRIGPEPAKTFSFRG